MWWKMVLTLSLSKVILKKVWFHTFFIAILIVFAIIQYQYLLVKKFEIFKKIAWIEVIYFLKNKVILNYNLWKYENLKKNTNWIKK